MMQIYEKRSWGGRVGRKNYGNDQNQFESLILNNEKLYF
jgi:hypothetical protein